MNEPRKTLGSGTAVNYLTLCWIDDGAERQSGPRLGRCHHSRFYEYTPYLFSPEVKWVGSHLKRSGLSAHALQIAS